MNVAGVVPSQDLDGGFAERDRQKESAFRGKLTSGTSGGHPDFHGRHLQANLAEPWDYLESIFTQLAHNPSGDSLVNLLPDRWLNANLTIAGKSKKWI